MQLLIIAYKEESELEYGRKELLKIDTVKSKSIQFTLNQVNWDRRESREITRCLKAFISFPMKYSTEPQFLEFWKNLKVGHDLFISEKKLLNFEISKIGEYIF